MKDKLKSKQYAENELAWLTHLFVSSQYLHDFLPVHYSLNRLVEGDAEPTLTTSGLCYMYVLELIKNLRGDESRLKYARRADAPTAGYYYWMQAFDVLLGMIVNGISYNDKTVKRHRACEAGSSNYPCSKTKHHDTRSSVMPSSTTRQGPASGSTSATSDSSGPSEPTDQSGLSLETEPLSCEKNCIEQNDDESDSCLEVLPSAAGAAHYSSRTRATRADALSWRHHWTTRTIRPAARQLLDRSTASTTSQSGWEIELGLSRIRRILVKCE